MMSKGGVNMSGNDPYTKDSDTRFTLRMPTNLLDTIKDIASKNKRSAAKQIEFILEQWIAENISKEQK